MQGHPHDLRPHAAVPRIAALWLALAVGGTGAAGAGGEPIDFSRDVRPILARNCFLCHGPDVSSRKAKLRLDVRAGAVAPTRGGGPPAVAPGDAAASELIARVTAEDGDLRMPPGERPPLTAEEIAVLRRWIDEGAEYDVHWSWRPLAGVTPPDVDDPAWSAHPVDRFLAAGLARRGLAPAARAEQSVLVRRLALDLTGLPPDPDSVAAFLEDDSPEAWATLVDRLLASPHYGERWARHWLDLVRYAETHGHEFDYPIRHAWRYRDYIIRALNADVPYDRFVTEHIAGDLVAESRPHPDEGYDESIIGTGFWYLGQGTHGPVDVRGDEAERIANQIDVFGKAFLGLTISCAQCHDHKFDAITTEDFYSLAGFLQSSRRQEAYLDPQGRIADAARALDELAAAAAPRVRAALGGLPDDLADRIAAAADTVRQRRAEAEADAKAAGDDEKQDGAKPDPDAGLTGWAAALADPALVAEGHPLREIVGPLLADGAAAPAPPPSAAPDAPERGAAFATFDEPDAYDGWFESGTAFAARPVAAGEAAVGADGPRLAPPGAAASGVRGGRFRGALRSPTFAIDCEHIEYRISGRGRIRLIIDGFVLDEFNALLFEGFTFDVDTAPGAWIVRRQNVGRYRGHRAHIELIDDTDRGLAVDEIRFTDHPDALGPGAASASGVAGAAEALAAVIVGAARRWREGDASVDDVSVLNWLLAHGRIPLDDDELDAVVRRAGEVHASLPRPVRVLAIQEGTPESERIFVRGDHRNLGAVAPRRFVVSLAGADQAPVTGSGRLELAERLLAPSNPLPARVLVNRVWLHLFGEGLVPTPDDFGALGEPPVDPELLDWLAAWLRDEGGWSVKRLVRLLVTSEAYRMSSVPRDAEAASAIDPANRLLHRARVRRLDAEAIRDSMLAVSGRLDPSVGGPPVPVHLTPFMTGRGRPGKSGSLDGDGRRSIYLEVRRNFLPPMMTAFDAPVPASTIGRRHRSNVPAQALTMLNDPFVLEQARVWARRVLAEDDRTPGQRIGSMYRRAFARSAAPEEVDLATAFLRGQASRRGADGWTTDEDAWTDYAHVLFNAKEFVFID